MPRFKLDLHYTDQGRRGFQSGEFEKTRVIARDFAVREGRLTIISIADRGPVGPLWIVEGEESNVRMVTNHFINEGNVTVTVQLI